MTYGDNDTGHDLYYGDLLADFFDEENNIVNPPSDAGFFLYNLFGKAFDDSLEIINQLLINLDPVTCELPYLDIIAHEWNLKRKPSWNDSYWRALVIFYYYNLETVAGIEFVLNIINEYYNRGEGEIAEPEKIVVEGYYSSFNLSDKFDSLSKCSDKFVRNDPVSSMRENVFNVDFKNNPPNEIIEELLKLIENGSVT